MNENLLKLRRIVRPVGSLAFCVSLMAAPGLRSQDPQPQENQQPAPDNTKNNKDHNTRPTADDQKANASDRALTQKIRKAIHDDKGLSTYAHNVKIVTQGGKVTLRGPVRSEEEKTSVQAKATEIAGEGNVSNELEVAPAK